MESVEEFEPTQQELSAHVLPRTSNGSSDAPNEKSSDEVIAIPSHGIESGETDDEKDAKEGKSGGFGAYFRLYKYSSPLDVGLRLCGLLASCAAGSALPLMTIIFGRLINNFNGYTSGGSSSLELLSEATSNVLIIVYLFIGKFVSVYIHSTCFTITANRTTSALRKAYIEAILRQDLAYFDSATPGSVATSISTNADMVLSGLSEKVGVLIQGLAMMLSAYVVAFTRQWNLTLVTATTMPFVITVVGITVALDSKLEAKILEIYSKAGGLVEEAFSSIRIVTAFSAGNKLRQKYDIYLDTVKAFGVKKGPILGVQYSTEFTVIFCAYSLSFWYGLHLLLRGSNITAGTIFTVLFSVLIGTSAITMIAPSIGEFSKAAAAASKIFEVIDRKLNIDPLSNEGAHPEPGSGCFELHDISFAYPSRPSVRVLDHVSIAFEAGKVTAIVGASGSGKSTIVGLLQRWYDPLEGKILLDGEDIKDLNVRWLRTQIGFVQQEPVLFNDTVYNNVAHGLYGSEMDNLPESEKRKIVQAACTEANADKFIQMLPQGYDTNVGERGGLVSGGQKQRIAIARSIVSNPHILLLDEATSALDPKAEEIVQAALDRVSKSRTTIMIAHKLSTVQKADKIIVMTQGRIIEQGSHSSLLAAKGVYASLVYAQNLHQEVEHTQDTADADDLPESDEIPLEKQLTPARSIPAEPDASDNISRRLSLAHCLCIIFYEQRHLWPYLLAGGLASLGGGAVFPLQAFLFSNLITVFQLPRDQMQDRGNFWALMFFVLALGVLVCYASIGLFFTIAGFFASRFYRSEYFGAMLRQDIEFFEKEGNAAGSMTSKLSTDPQRLQDLISSNFCLILIVIVNLVSSCTLALAVGWKLAVVSIFGCIPPLFFAGFTRMRLEMTSQDRAKKPYEESVRFVSETVAAIRTVSSLSLESKILSIYADRLGVSLRKSYKHTVISMIMFGLSESLDLAAFGLVFWYGSKLLAEGEYSTQKFFLIFYAIIFGGQAAGTLFGYTLNTTKAHSAANHIIHLRNSQPPINSSTGIEAGIESDKDLAIEFENVQFSYPSRANIPVLRGLNMSIHRGQSVGVVGASGCGKTTTIALLERFYDISSGSLKISGVELRDLDVHAYRSKIGLVSQETTIYQGSIRENVMLGISENDPEANEERVINACKAANIHDFILSLPEGYDTDAGSHGLALSGGQRQRLAIARALIRDPEILLFDEATSALDTQSEQVVLEALKKAGKGRTVVSVAHRLSTIRHCDCIFVIEQGRVVEHGTHEELIGIRGVYLEMVKGQSLDREVVG